MASNTGVPPLRGSMSMQAGEIPKRRVSHLKERRFAKSNAAVTLKFIAKPVAKQKAFSKMCIICYADAPFVSLVTRHRRGAMF